MLEPAGTGQPFPRAFLRVGGASLAQHQLGLALAAECQRLICIARGPSAELSALEQSSEAAGLRFHLITGPQQLPALVTAADELVVITEGLFADPAVVAPLLQGTHSAVFALPDDGAVAEGFERLDINHAAAGVMRIPGALVERLHDLPPDCDAISALTRIALQSGEPMVQVPPEARASAGWRMVRNDTEALAIETEWLRRRLLMPRSASLAERLARVSVLSFGSSLLHAGNASGVASIGAAATLVLALGAAWLEAAVLAFALVALAWVLVRATELLRGAERQACGVAMPAIPRADVLGWLTDASLIFVCVFSLAAPSFLPSIELGYRIFAPLMLVLLMHLSPRFLIDGLAAWTCDRAVVAVLLAVAACLGHLGEVVRLLAVGLAIAGIVLPPGRTNPA